jgi:hypothetical protein
MATIESEAWGERKDKHARKAAEDHVIDVYTMCTRNTTKEWAFDDDDMAKLRYNDSPGKRDGYLIAGIASSRILEYEANEDGEEWTVEVVPDVGFVLDPEVYRVYQADNGDWIVEEA